MIQIHSYVSLIMKIQRVDQLIFFFEIIYHTDSKKNPSLCVHDSIMQFTAMYFYISF